MNQSRATRKDVVLGQVMNQTAASVSCRRGGAVGLCKGGQSGGRRASGAWTSCSSLPGGKNWIRFAMH